MSSANATLFNRSSDFWSTYRKGRPQVPSSFFERIFAYHSFHDGEFGTVHDAGAGPGVHSWRLAQRFAKVIVTDVSGSNIELAKSQLLEPKYEFHTTRLEDTIDFTPGSVDMVFAAAMLHFTDVPKSLEAVASQLKPSGTFAVPVFGLAVLRDPHAQAVWAKLFQTGIEQVVRKLGESVMEAASVNGSAYDSVPLPDAYFEPGALRIKLNETVTDIPGGHYYDMLVPPCFRPKYPPLSRIGTSDSVSFEDDEDWKISKDITALKEVISTFPFDQDTEEMEHLLKEMEDIVGEREMDGYWVVSLILATRK